MKCAWLLLGCLTAMVMLQSSEGLWRSRSIIRIPRIRIPRIRIPRIRIPRIRIPRIRIPIRTRWRFCPFRSRITLRRYFCRTTWSAGADKAAIQNFPDLSNFQLDPNVCKLWYAKEKSGQCNIKWEVCQANCTGCDPSGVTCPDGNRCPDNCCVCMEGEMLKEYVKEKGASIEKHVTVWLDKMGLKDKDEKDEMVKEILGEDDEEGDDVPDEVDEFPDDEDLVPDEEDQVPDEEDQVPDGEDAVPDEDVLVPDEEYMTPDETQDDGQEPGDDNDETEVDMQKKPSDAKQ